MKHKTCKIKYTIEIPETEIRWIVCQHCKKSVYGVMVVKDNICPNKYTSTNTSGAITKWTWRHKSKRKHNKIGKKIN